jgi:hypothetical protein
VEAAAVHQQVDLVVQQLEEGEQDLLLVLAMMELLIRAVAEAAQVMEELQQAMVV